MKKSPAPVPAPVAAPKPTSAIPIPEEQVFVDMARSVVSAINAQVAESTALRRVVESLTQDKGRPRLLEATVERNGSGQMVRIVVTPKYGD